MMTIKDLSASKELDRKAMTEVRGGNANVFSANAQGSFQGAVGGLVGVNENTQTLHSFNSAVDYTDLDVLKFAIGAGNVVV
jgi:hypothetical protein